MWATLSQCAQLWTGDFNVYSSSVDMDSWSWDNEVGQWQSYIHGPNNISDWVELDESYKNPADSVSNQGAKVKINGSAEWDVCCVGFLRTELIPEGFEDTQQTGTLYYQFSMKQTTTNQLHSQYEHQLVFFESHFADIKYGGNGGSTLYFYVNQEIVWSTTFTADIWYNFALEVDYNSNQVALWGSIGGTALTQIVKPISTSTSQSDWHVGHLRLPITQGGNPNYQDPTEEWLFYSTISIQNSLIQPFSTGSVSSSSSSSSQPITTGHSQPKTTGIAQPKTTGLAQPKTTGLSEPKTTAGIPQPKTTGKVVSLTSESETSHSISTGRLTTSKSKKLTTDKVAHSSTSTSTSSSSTSGKATSTSSSSVAGSTSSTSSSSSSCSQAGQMQCVTSNTYESCVQHSDGSFGWAAAQSCQVGLSCHQSGIYIYCY